MTTYGKQLDRVLARIMARLRAQASELRRLEWTGAAPGEPDDRREVIDRLQIEAFCLGRPVGPVARRRP